MTIGGWIFLVLSWGVIVVLCACTLARVLGLRVENMLAPLDIETEPKAAGSRKRGKKKK